MLTRVTWIWHAANAARALAERQVCIADISEGEW